MEKKLCWYEEYKESTLDPSVFDTMKNNLWNIVFVYSYQVMGNMLYLKIKTFNEVYENQLE